MFVKEKIQLGIVLYLWSVCNECLCNFMSGVLCMCLQSSGHPQKATSSAREEVWSDYCSLFLIARTYIHNDWSRWFAISNTHFLLKTEGVEFAICSWINFSGSLLCTRCLFWIDFGGPWHSICPRPSPPPTPHHPTLIFLGEK